MIYFFLLMAIAAFAGFGLQAQRRNGHGMAYCLVLIVIWLGLAAWWSGRIG